MPRVTWLVRGRPPGPRLDHFQLLSGTLQVTTRRAQDPNPGPKMWQGHLQRSKGGCVSPSLSGTLHVREQAEGRSCWLAPESCLAAAAGSRVCWWLGGSVRELTVLRKAGRLLTPVEQAAWAWARRFAAGREAGEKLALVRNPGAPSQLLVLAPPPLGLGVCVWWVEAGTWDPNKPFALLGSDQQSREHDTPRARPLFYSPSHPTGSRPRGLPPLPHTQHTDTHTDTHMHRLTHPYRQSSGVTSALQPLVTDSDLPGPTPAACFGGSRTWLHGRVLWGPLKHASGPGHTPEARLHSLSGPAAAAVFSRASW